jgi:hypothetical protein
MSRRPRLNGETTGGTPLPSTPQGASRRTGARWVPRGRAGSPVIVQVRLPVSVHPCEHCADEPETPIPNAFACTFPYVDSFA